MMEMDVVFRKIDRVISRKILDELILVPIRGSVADMECLYTLNEVGARVYQLVDGKKTVGEICDAVVEEFEVGTDRARADVNEFLEKLIEIGSIEEVGSRPRTGTTE